MMNSEVVKSRVESISAENADSKSDTESVASNWQSAKAEQDMAELKIQLVAMALAFEQLKKQQAQDKAEAERKRQADALAHNRELERLRIVQAQQAEAARKAQAQAQGQANAQAQANAQTVAAQQAAAKALSDTLDPQQFQARLQACNNRGDRNGYKAEMAKYQDAVKRSNLK